MVTDALLCSRHTAGVVTAAAGGSDTGSGSRDLAKRTVADLREECRRRGLWNYTKLKKDDLIRLLRGDELQIDILDPRHKGRCACTHRHTAEYG